MPHNIKNGEILVPEEVTKLLSEGKNDEFKKEIDKLKKLNPDKMLTIKNFDLSNLNIENLKLSWVNFVNCNLSGTHFTNCELKNNGFYSCNLTDLHFTDGLLKNNILIGNNITNLAFELTEKNTRSNVTNNDILNNTGSPKYISHSKSYPQTQYEHSGNYDLNHNTLTDNDLKKYANNLGQYSVEKEKKEEKKAEDKEMAQRTNDSQIIQAGAGINNANFNFLKLSVQPTEIHMGRFGFYTDVFSGGEVTKNHFLKPSAADFAHGEVATFGLSYFDKKGHFNAYTGLSPLGTVMFNNVPITNQTDINNLNANAVSIAHTLNIDPKTPILAPIKSLHINEEMNATLKAGFNYHFPKNYTLSGELDVPISYGLKSSGHTDENGIGGFNITDKKGAHFDYIDNTTSYNIKNTSLPAYGTLELSKQISHVFAFAIGANFKLPNTITATADQTIKAIGGHYPSTHDATISNNAVDITAHSGLTFSPSVSIIINVPDKDRSR